MLLDNLLEKYDGTKMMIESCIETVLKYEKIVIWGAGVGGGTLYCLLKKNGLENRIVAWGDGNKLKHGTSYMNEKLHVLSLQDAVEVIGKTTGVIVASSAYNLIRDELIMSGVPKENIFLYNFAFMDLDYTDCEYIRDHISDFERAYRRMEDDKSKSVFCNILNYKITKDETHLSKLQAYTDNEENQYFDNTIFDFVQDECFLDIGAYIGDTFDAFKRMYKDGWLHYYGLEADHKIYLELVTKVSSMEENEKCSIYNIAAWDEDTVLYFDSVAGSSTMKSDKGVEAIEAKPIDELIDERVSFIKMDIEGAEYKALVGLSETIKRNKPILAVCVYHKRDDYFKLTDYIENLLPGEYVYYMRQYRYTPTETVCYAIPKNRRKASDEDENCCCSANETK